MGKLRGFMEYDRIKEEAIDPKKRIENYKEFTLAPKTEQLQEQGGRCMDCGVPFCHSGGPLGNLIPDFNDAVYKTNGKKPYIFYIQQITSQSSQVVYVLHPVKKLVF